MSVSAIIFALEGRGFIRSIFGASVFTVFPCASDLLSTRRALANEKLGERPGLLRHHTEDVRASCGSDPKTLRRCHEMCESANHIHTSQVIAVSIYDATDGEPAHL